MISWRFHVSAARSPTALQRRLTALDLTLIGAMPLGKPGAFTKVTNDVDLCNISIYLTLYLSVLIPIWHIYIYNYSIYNYISICMCMCMCVYIYNPRGPRFPQGVGWGGAC